MPRETFLTFLVGTETFALGIHEVQMVVPIEEFQKVPKTPSLIKGISEVHGKIMTLIELSQIFGISIDGKGPFHAAILASPFSHMAICLPSEFDIVEISEEEAEKKGKEKETWKSFERRLKIKSKECRLIKAEDIIHICEEKIREHVKKNIQQMSPGEKV